MHEMGITQQILSQSFEAAKAEDAVRINEIRITVGELTEIVETALQFAFEVLRQDTIAADAELVVTILPPRSRCGQCGHEYEHDRFDMTCPECGMFMVESIQGHELRIDSIDIDTEEDLARQGSGETEKEA